MHYGFHKIVPDNKPNRKERELTQKELSELNKVTEGFINGISKRSIPLNEEQIQTICNFYIQGAELDWDSLYGSYQGTKLSVPTYPFEKTRCWLGDQDRNVEGELVEHCVVRSALSDIYSTIFNVDKHWVLKEHKVNGKFLPPGTVFLDMVLHIFKNRIKNTDIDFSDVIFLNPLVVALGEDRLVHLELSKSKGSYGRFSFQVSSKNNEQDDSWEVHCVGNIELTDKRETIEKINIKEIIERANHVEVSNSEVVVSAVETGPRWKTLKKVYIGSDELLAYLEIPDAYKRT